MATQQFFVVLLDHPTPAQRNAVHARIKRATKSWWHYFDDAWIVGGGKDATEWNNRLAPAFKSGDSALLVFRLPGVNETQSWAYFGPDSSKRVGWLHKNYTQDKR